MLEIRYGQLAAIAVAMEAPLVQWLRQHLRRILPAQLQELGDSELERRIRIGLARAHHHRLSDSNARARFVETMFVVAPGFDQHPEIATLLRSSATLPPEVRMEHVLTRVKTHAWEEARAQDDGRVWSSDLPAAT